MREPVGVILAGGRGRRLGGAKATIPLAGRPLLEHPLAAMRAALGDGATVAVVAKPGTPLPFLAGAELWLEPVTPSHPLVGLVAALQHAAGRPVLACPVDLPFVTPATLQRLAHTPADGTLAVLACVDGELAPLLGRFEPAALGPLRAALTEGDGGGAPGRLPAMRAVAAALGARTAEVAPGELENVNTVEDLRRAEARLRGRSCTAPPGGHRIFQTGD